jgi:UDP-N-acetylmuramyl pentapeptide phosphotransferase/UDP-N-acetylglucosamine-1-phosphate transferase
MSHYSPLLALLVTTLLILLVRLGKFGTGIQDIPNERSLHSVPVPRVGGVGMMAGLVISWILTPEFQKWWVVVPAIGLFIVSLLDDMYSLPVRARLVPHLAAATVLVAGSGLMAQQGPFVALLLLFLAVWMTNLYNFMDGSDGLAGGMALFGFGFHGIAALMGHNDGLATFNFTVSAVALGFLLFNFPPAKVFMGDAGSIPLGFLAAAGGLWGWQEGHWHAWFPLLVFSPFIADASVTLLKRSLRGLRITEAHRDHYYQRAVRMGLGHRTVALAEYVLMLGAGLTGLAYIQRSWPWDLLLAWCGIYAVLMFILESRWKKYNQQLDTVD